MLATQVATFHTRVALVHGVVLHTMNTKHRIAHGVNINVDGTTCVTEPTKSTSCFDAHVSPLAISLRE